MKKTKKNNKGFSLVELIVVVLIMAIIAVALAPQVMKWVGNSRTSTDITTYNTMKSNVEIALADEDVMAQVKDATENLTVKISNSGVTLTPATGALADKLAEMCDISTYKFKDSTNSATITIAKVTGKISGDAAFETKADNVK